MQILENRGGRVNLDAGTLLLSRELFAGRVRRGIRRDHLEHVSAVREQAGIKRVELVGQAVFQQQPARLAIASIVK